MITESRFHMWRTVFAVAHADRDVTPAERQYMTEVIESLELAPQQEEILRKDIFIPGDPFVLFKKISDLQDRNDFFKFSKQMIWSDDDYSAVEKRIIVRLKEMADQSLDLEDMVGSIELELEEEKKITVYKPPEREKGWRGFLKELKETLFEED